MLRTLLFAFAFLAFAGSSAATEAGWALLREGGQVVLMRNAYAPGTNDPASFDIENCATQRHLSDRGRQQARRIGALFAARAEPVEKVLTSRFCRCSATAELAFGASTVEQFPALDYFSGDAEAQAERNAEVVEAIRVFTGSGNLVMVTHLETIEALLNVRPREGEAIIVDRSADPLRVAGRIVFN